MIAHPILTGVLVYASGVLFLLGLFGSEDLDGSTASNPMEAARG